MSTSSPSSSSTRSLFKLMIMVQLSMLSTGTSAFVLTHGGHNMAQSQQQQHQQNNNNNIVLQMAAVEGDDEITRQLARAKAVLAKSKAKIESKELMLEEEDENKKAVPFFAQTDKGNKKDKVTKSRNDQGLITTDGDMMAELSEGEVWERRSLDSVFNDEAPPSDGASSLSDRDVSASIFNLRKKLQTSDYMKIFDKRNYFIGEE